MKPKLRIDVIGTKRWLLRGRLHREDGPAIEWTTGCKEWFRNGKHHREDGPSIIYEDGHAVWLLNGRVFSFNNWCEILNIPPEEKTLLILKYG